MSSKNTMAVTSTDNYSPAIYPACLRSLLAALTITLICVAVPAAAFDYEVIDVSEGDSPLVVDNIKVLGVLRLFTTYKDAQQMVELSALAWSEDEQLLYALSDHGAVFHFHPQIVGQRLTAIDLVRAFPLRDQSGDALGYPFSDSEGLYLANGHNGVSGDDELLISFENQPRLQWHRADGTYLKHEPLPAPMEDRKTYYRRGKALESVTIHPELGILTAPEYPLEESEWNQLTLYSTDGARYSLQRDVEEDFALCALELMPDGSLLALQRRHQLFAPSWTTRLDKLVFTDANRPVRKPIANIIIGKTLLPVDNYEGLTRHQGSRYFMISDNNEHFMQQTLLVYFEVLE